MLQVSNRYSRTWCEICSKLTIKTPERRHWRRSDAFTPLRLIVEGEGANKQGVGVRGKCIKILGKEGGRHNKITLREYWDYTIKWGRESIIKSGGGGYDFWTDVFSIRKNVQKWTESQMDRFVWMFCFEVKIYQ